MSGPPKRKPKGDVPVFPDPEQHTNLTAMRKEIRSVLINIQKTLSKGEARHKLIEFTGVLHPGSFHDPGRLPYESSTGRSRKNRREDCLLAMISKLVQDYWWLVLEEQIPEEDRHIHTLDVQTQIGTLCKIAEKGVSRCQIIGDENKGYELAC